MRMGGRRESNNVEDMRGGGGGGMRIGGGIGLGTIILAFVLWKACGIPPEVILGGSQMVQQPATNQRAVQSNANVGTDEDRRFVSTVLADTEDTWGEIFRENNMQYEQPKLVLFTGMVRSGCGAAQSAMGPFYCPADHKVYLDMDFFREMRSSLGITGEVGNSASASSRADQAGDFARAYVIAHEVGHHVQNILGISDQVQRAQQAAGSRAIANQYSVRLELQADCFAGVWAKRTNQRTNFLQEGDLQEAVQAAQQIGDDRLQQAAGRAVVPDSFTHGSSEQRMRWFMTGYQSGRVDQCDTFQANA